MNHTLTSKGQQDALNYFVQEVLSGLFKLVFMGTWFIGEFEVELPERYLILPSNFPKHFINGQTLSYSTLDLEGTFQIPKYLREDKQMLGKCLKLFDHIIVLVATSVARIPMIFFFSVSFGFKFIQPFNKHLIIPIYLQVTIGVLFRM